MNLFLDSSVNVAAVGSRNGASRLLFEQAARHGWKLQTSSYVLHEVLSNITTLGGDWARDWIALNGQLLTLPDVLTFPWPTVLAPAKDRPILFTAAAWSDVLLTLDRRDFHELLGREFYGMPILTPGDFLDRERRLGRFNLK